MGRKQWTTRVVLPVAAGLLLALLCVGGYELRKSEMRLPYTGMLAHRGLKGWENLGGIWTVQGNTVINDSYERGAKLLYGSESWSNYLVSADVQLSGTGGDAGLMLRSRNEQLGPNAYNGYYAGVRSLDGQLVLGHAQYGWLESRTAAFPSGIVAHHWYHLVVAAVGCNVVAVATDPATGARSAVELSGEPCFQTGRIGLRSYGTSARWRRVQARAISPSEFAVLRSQATPLRGSGLPPSQQGHARFAAETASLQLPVVTIGSLRYVSILHPPRVKIRGTVVLRRPMLFVEDATGGIAIPDQDPSSFATGDEVEASGSPSAQPFHLMLRDAHVSVFEPGKPLPPKSVTGTEGATGAYQGEYIELIGRVVQNDVGTRSPSLVIAADAQRFLVLLPEASYGTRPPQLPTHALVRVRGVEVVDEKQTYGSTPFLLYLPNLESLDLLASPPWWSLQNAVWLVPMTLMVLLLLLLLRSRERHMRLKAAMEERQRLGREMHDTLAQSFAGIGYQLQAVRTSLRTGSAGLGEHVELAMDMVRQSHQEARRSIASMQPDLADGNALAALLEERACHLAQGTPLSIIVKTLGEVMPLTPRAADVLFRTGLEAIANALRHASPQKLLIDLRFTRREATLRVTDDGCGFDEALISGGLGLRGMRARAEGSGARLSIHTALGTGTEIEVRIPLRSAPGFVKRWRRRKDVHPYEQT
jgi:signal transduction histidine kinase